VYVVKELPIAGYSVVKELGSDVPLPHQAFVGPPSPFGCGATAFAFAGWLAEPKLPSRRLFRKPRVADAKAGGEYRARTGDLLVANQALSQLS